MGVVFEFFFFLRLLDAYISNVCKMLKYLNVDFDCMLQISDGYFFESVLMYSLYFFQCHYGVRNYLNAKILQVVQIGKLSKSEFFNIYENEQISEALFFF